jgi:hypothetical protein
MKLSADQVPLFWRLWKEVCISNHWTKANGYTPKMIDAKRKELLARCGFKSLTEVDPLAGFSRVKRELLKEAANLEGGREEVDPHIESGRTSRWFIEHDLIPCIALYVDDAWAYVSRIATDKFRWRTRDEMQRPITLDDLTDHPIVREVRGELKEFPSQLEQLKYTLARCLSRKEKKDADGRVIQEAGLRNKAGHSIHDMRTLAGLKCRCARCSKPAKVALATVKAYGIEGPEPDPF